MKRLKLAWFLMSLSVLILPAQKRNDKSRPVPTLLSKSEVALDTSYLSTKRFRNIGPFRGGRSAAVTGIAGKPYTFLFGSVGGGVWQTKDAGQTWRNLSDGFFGGSIGAVAVSEWDQNVVYVGGGEKTVRGNVSYGLGMWKSVDAGKTWQHIGLSDSRHITRIRIHPQNPDLLYVSALGHLFGPNDQRGVFRSKDGGKTWERILFVSPDAGAVDLVMDSSNPRVLYASTWQVKRTPYSLESGGHGSGLWKSTDGGDTWQNISRANGLPKGLLGIIGITVSPVNPERLWAIVEAEDGGVFRSDDAGINWRKLNGDRNLRQRAWYYTRIYADPKNEDQVYVLNVGFWRSKDGGRTYSEINTPHGDHHDLWIDPIDPLRMIVGDDGGAQVSVDGGENWSTYHNQPTAQFYRVVTDDHFPYRIYGAQQDNSTVRIVHRSDGFGITERDWEETAGGESGHIAVDPRNNDIVYGGSYGGFLTRKNHRTGEERDINPWPDNPMGHGAGDLKYRFQWNFPLLYSRHSPTTLYAAAQVLFKTENEGQTWEPISNDLTRNDPKTLGPSGGPITKDNTSVEYYGTIFSVAEGLEEGVIWTGSDDGLVHITRNGGKKWKQVTPPTSLLPEWAQINSMEPHPTNPGGLYLAATRYKSDDSKPYLLKTTDYGETWTLITKGIAPEHFTRVIRADPVRSGLLFAGTEFGLYASIDDGQQWFSFQKNLPIVPITDITIKNNDLILATQGRSFWVMDDLTLLHQLTSEVSAEPFVLFKPRPTYRMSGGGGRASLTVGENPVNGVQLLYYFKQVPDSAAVKLKLIGRDGKTIRTYSPKGKPETRMSLKKGMNTFVWNMRYPEAERFDGLILWAGGTQGPKAPPGVYEVRLFVGKDSLSVPFEILKDPRVQATQADLEAQFEFLVKVREDLSAIH
ncbi:MAG TPA: glycosyl hydrolase, partial [Rhodothermales bacterium]|nr:glycosyl hydrolase [Rhodothermales bacterium]